MTVDELTEWIHGMLDRHDDYFDRAQEAVDAAEANHWYVSDADHYWNLLPADLRQVSESLSQDLAPFVRRVLPIFKASSVLTEVDHRKVAFLARSLRSALRLRSYREWPPEVLHDEGDFKGIQPGGQSDDYAATPLEAKGTTHSVTQWLLETLDFVVPGGAHVSGASIDSAPREPGLQVRPGTAFIMMWMDPAHPELRDVADSLKRCFKKFGIEAVRADDIEHEDVITQRIIDEIRTAEFLIADLTGERPNVYYEVGYAHAIGRRVILYRNKESRVHFDLQSYNCPPYENLHDLEGQLTRRLNALTNETPVE